MRTVLFAFLFLQAGHSLAQTSRSAVGAMPFSQSGAQELTRQGAELLAQAQSSTAGSAGMTLETYPGHYTMLTARVKSGGPELHKNFSDIFVILDGEATEVVGGSLVDPQEASPGEVHGSALVGGERHVMKKGDVVHILAGVPHQTLLAEGAKLVYYVIKVEVPKQ